MGLAVNATRVIPMLRRAERLRCRQMTMPRSVLKLLSQNTVIPGMFGIKQDVCL